MIWEGLATTELTCAEQGPIAVIYPGRASGDKGPDFRDAVIKHGSRLMRGDVEVHVRSSDWCRHGHHRDPEYNNTILHVVMWHDSGTPTSLQGGRSIPVLCLAKALRRQGRLLPERLPCFGVLDRLGRQTLTETLNEAGERRFKGKAAIFRKEVDRLASREDAGQVLFTGIMRALGYAGNTGPFEELAERVSLNCIERSDGLTVKQAFLLGTAGLLPSQRWPERVCGEREVRDLERIWRSVDRNPGTPQTMEAGCWRLSGVYPNNSPVRRLVAMAHLIERHSTSGLLAAMLKLVGQASLAEGHERLEQGLTVAADSYWRNHFDFGAKSRTAACALLGRGKAGELATNVILPFSFSWGQLTGDVDLAKTAMAIYRSYPRLADNCITRHMTEQLCLDGPGRFDACRQQGLIHIFRHYCREGRCSLCPFAV